jgi:pimeloyl-ACP methyl ester carboxylesterase
VSPRSIGRSRGALSTLLAVFLAACGSSGDGATGTPTAPPVRASTAAPSTSPSPTPAADVASRRVEFPSATGERLVGRVFAPDHDRVVVLAHQVDDDQSDWFDFAALLASRRLTVLTFNFQGYCGGGGCSRGNAPSDELWNDVVGAARFARELGARRVALVGASMGGEASIAAAARLGNRISGLATLSASLGFAEAGPGAARRDAAAVRVPKLFVAGRADTAAATAARTFARVADDRRRLVLLPFGEHGVDLLEWEPGERTVPLLVGFLERVLR